MHVGSAGNSYRPQALLRREIGGNVSSHGKQKVAVGRNDTEVGELIIYS